MSVDRLDSLMAAPLWQDSAQNRFSYTTPYLVRRKQLPEKPRVNKRRKDPPISAIILSKIISGPLEWVCSSRSWTATLIKLFFHREIVCIDSSIKGDTESRAAGHADMDNGSLQEMTITPSCSATGRGHGPLGSWVQMQFLLWEIRVTGCI